MTSPINALIDAAVRCSKCGKQGFMSCDCWKRCACGITYEVGGWCRRCGPVTAAACVCSLPAAKRRECGDARNLKTPCRCACHRKEK